ncbi:hypothetical protein ACIQOV_16525 [Kitasatospora sp. NPDC091257]|uniref:hypothetical protein n=1 Tax=Kitasatospora sp. NPDC091257 TaxID=3364084 RepID=UPI0038161836
MAAERGAAQVLNDLHAGLRWTEGALRLRHRTRPLPGPTAGAGLPLVPSVFTGPALRTRPAPPDPLQLACPARGTGTLWATAPAAGAEAVAAVLGRSRTRLLTELAARSPRPSSPGAPGCRRPRCPST